MVPYATVGIGGLTPCNKTASEMVNLGVTKNESYATGTSETCEVVGRTALRPPRRLSARDGAETGRAPLFFGREATRRSVVR
jgi:hypothetical protein